MRTWPRLRETKKWVYEEICKGREYKCPKNSSKDGYGPAIYDFTTAEPRVFLAWQPMRPDDVAGYISSDPVNVAPSITIMPTQGFIRNMEEERFDRYSGIHRPKNMGQTFGMQFLFMIYEPGIRLPDFEESMKSGHPDMSLLKDGTEAGLQTLVDWMDDLIELVLRERNVPGTDLIFDKTSSIYSLYTDQNYVKDLRPYYIGFVNVGWQGYANYGSENGRKSRTDRLLDD